MHGILDLYMTNLKSYVTHVTNVKYLLDKIKMKKIDKHSICKCKRTTNNTTNLFIAIISMSVTYFPSGNLEIFRYNIKEMATLSKSRPKFSQMTVHTITVLQYKNSRTTNSRVSFRDIMRVRFSLSQPYLHLNYISRRNSGADNMDSSQKTFIILYSLSYYMNK